MSRPAPLLALLLATLLALPAAADTDMYRPGDWRIARPGARPVSNFYPVAGFRPVDPSCYRGSVALDLSSAIPVSGEAKFHVNELITISPARRGTRFPYRHRWSVWSDPLSIGPVTSVSEGEGNGTARAWLSINIAENAYRLVTDVSPRAGSYMIDTTGPGVSRMDFEDFHFGFADHHYSYVDLSQLQAQAGNPLVAGALVDINALLSNRPPNVFVGDFFGTGVAGPPARGELRIEDTERLQLSWAGIEASGQREVTIVITCPDLVRQYDRLFGD